MNVIPSPFSILRMPRGSTLVLLAGVLAGCVTTYVDDPRTQRAEALTRVEDWDEAASLWTAIYLESGANNFDAGTEAARALTESERYGAANARLAELMKRRPGDAEHHELLGRTLEGLGRPSDAILEYEQAYAIDGARAVTLERLGALRLASGDVDSGLRLLQRCVQVAPRHHVATVRLALGAARAGRLDLAAPAVERAIARGDLAPRQVHEVVTRFQSDPRAVRWLLHLVERDPQDSLAARKLGEAFVAVGQFDSGLGWLERAAESDPGNVEVVVAYARGLKVSGRPARASSVLDHAESLDLTANESRLVEGLRAEWANAAADVPTDDQADDSVGSPGIGASRDQAKPKN